MTPAVRSPATGARAPLLVLDGLTRAERGRRVFGPVRLELAPAALGVVCGPSGSGRSSVLLAAAGRVRGLTGRGRLGPLDLVGQARGVRQRVAVARISHLVDLEPRLTVEESITERSLTEGVAAAAAEWAVARAEVVLGCTFGRRVFVGDLSRLDQGRLAVALATTRESALIVFDDVDHDLDPDDQRRLYAALTAVAGTGPAVLASTTTALSIPRHAAVATLDHAEN